MATLIVTTNSDTGVDFSANTDHLSIDIVPEDDLSFTEGDDPLRLAATGTLSDSDGNEDWDGGTLVVQITANNTDGDELGIQDDDDDSIDISVSGTDLLADSVTVGSLSASGGTVTNGTALTITFNDSATNDIVQEVLQSITYENTSDDPGGLTRTVTFTASDNDRGSDTEDKTVDITEVNDDPNVSVTGLNPTFIQGGGSQTLFSNAQLDPVEAGQSITGFTLYVDGVEDDGNEYLYISDVSVALVDSASASYQSGLAYAVGVNNGQMTVGFSFTGWSQSRIEDFVEGISYRNNAGNPTVTDTRTFHLRDIQDSDGGMASGGIGSTVTVAINEAPTLAGAPTDIYVEIEEASNIDLSAATLADEDSDSISLSLSVDTGTLTATRVDYLRISNGQDSFKIEGQAPSEVPVDAGNGGTVTLSGDIEDVNRYLSDPSNLQYTSATGVKGNDSATLTIQASQKGSGTNTLATINLDIGYASSTNAAPHSIALDGTSVTENLEGAVIGTVSARDSEGEAITFSAADSRFEIVGTTLKLKDGVSLDFEDDPSVRVGINATDTAGNSSRVYFNIKVGDVSELDGSDDAETLTGGDEDDTVFAAGGNDTVDSGNGRDTIDGGSGDDSIAGGNDDDSISGGDGDDFVDGGSGRDTLFGGAGDDDVQSGDDDDIVFAGAGDEGDDTISGGAGNDSLGGGAGSDSIAGDDGDDLIWSREGDDIVSGGAGDDVLFNGEGSDTVTGGAGDDTLWACAGDDVLTGGDGADTFVFGNAIGNDTVTDFDVADDSLSFGTNTGMTSEADVTAAASDGVSGGENGVMIDLGDGESIFLVGLSVSDLSEVTMTF